MTSNEDKPPSYDEALRDYRPPPSYSQTQAIMEYNLRVAEEERLSEMLNNTVEEETDFNTAIDNFDFSQLDHALDGVDLSSNV